MAEYSLTSIGTSIVTTLATATGIQKAEDLPDMSENVQQMDTPMLQVYPDKGESVSVESETQNYSFGGGNSVLKQKDWTFIADCYISQTTMFGQAMARFAVIGQALIDVMDAQSSSAPFGNPAIKSFQYFWERVTIEFSGEKYLTFRMTINVRIY